MDSLDDVAEVAYVELLARQLLGVAQESLHLLLRSAVSELQIVEHGVVLLGEALVGVLDGLHGGAHLVRVVGHVDHGHVADFGGLGGVAVQGADEGRAEARELLHVLVHALASRAVCVLRVLHHCVAALLGQRLHATSQLLVVCVAVERLPDGVGYHLTYA